MTVEEIKKLLIEIDADGLEGNYIYIDRNNIYHNDIKLWNDLAKELNIMSSVGF